MIKELAGNAAAWMLLFGLVIAIYDLYKKYFKVTRGGDAKDFDLLCLYMYHKANQKGKRLPFEIYGEWTKHSIKDSE